SPPASFRLILRDGGDGVCASPRRRQPGILRYVIITETVSRRARWIDAAYFFQDKIVKSIWLDGDFRVLVRECTIHACFDLPGLEGRRDEEALAGLAIQLNRLFKGINHI